MPQKHDPRQSATADSNSRPSSSADSPRRNGGAADTPSDPPRTHCQRKPLKENIRVEGERDIQTKVMTTLFALFAEVERDLISERTREGLAKAGASGRKLGRPKGSLGVSRLDGKEDEIRHFLELGVSKTAIAKITGVSRSALYSFMTTRGLRATP